MTDISITPANTVAGSDASIDKSYLAGATITAGQSVYLDTGQTPSRWELAQADGTALEAGSAGIGIALHGASDGQPLAVQVQGSITIGGTAVVGEIYLVSAAAGGIAPEGDITTATQRVTILGVGTSATVIKLHPLASGAQIPA